MLSFVVEGAEDIHDVAAFPVNFKKPIVVTALAGIGETGNANWDDFHPRVNVFSSPQAFQQSAIVGDVLTLTNVPLLGQPVEIGVADTRYYVSLDVTPFVIPPGEHWISIAVDRKDAFWSWTETTVPLGADIGKAYDVSQYYFYKSIHFTTGSLAIDVGGHLLCDADVVPVVFGDGQINVDDLLFVINHWSETGDSPADITADAIVNVDDLLAVINEWGACE
jgi:hypothetical protein